MSIHKGILTFFMLKKNKNKDFSFILLTIQLKNKIKFHMITKKEEFNLNLPNKISIFRTILIPVFLVFMFLPYPAGEIHIVGTDLPYNHLIAAIIFIFASLTDWFDGYYARKHNLVTNFGKFLDPLADKLLVSAALIALVDLNYVPSWMVIIIISREFAVTGLRLILASDQGEVVAANMLGKIKTTTQLIAISAYLLHDIGFAYFHIPFASIMMYVCVFFTVWSGWDYFYKNKHVFKKN